MITRVNFFFRNITKNSTEYKSVRITFDKLVGRPTESDLSGCAERIQTPNPKSKDSVFDKQLVGWELLGWSEVCEGEMLVFGHNMTILRDLLQERRDRIENDMDNVTPHMKKYFGLLLNDIDGFLNKLT